MEGKLAQVGGQSEEKCDPMKFKLGWYFLCTSQPSGDWKSQRQFLDSNHSLGVSISVKSVASKFLQPSKMVDSNIPPNIPNLTSDPSITSRLFWPQKGKLNISHSTNEFSSVMAAQESGPQMASAIGDLVTYWQQGHVENQYFVSMELADLAPTIIHRSCAGSSLLLLLCNPSHFRKVVHGLIKQKSQLTINLIH